MKQATTQLYKVLLSMSNDKDLIMATTGRNMQSFNQNINI